jgi:YVTN family beta-propeller protein
MNMKRITLLTLLFAVVLFQGAEAQTEAYIPSAADDSVVRVTLDDPPTYTSVTLGDSPYGAAALTDSDYIFVTRTGGDVITAIPRDAFSDTDTQVDISVGAAPRGVAIESDGHYVYVANYDDDTVSEIYTGTLSVTDTISVGDGPWGVAAIYDETDGTPKAYVSNHLDDSISVITNSGVQTIADVGNGPLGVALTPDGDYLYVANYNADTVAVIDTRDLELIKTITVGDGPWGVAVGSDGDYVYVTNSLADTVTVIRTSDNLVQGTYTTGNQPMGVAAPKNGSFAYVVNYLGNTITRITAATGARETLATGQIDGAYGLGAFFAGSRPERPTDLTAETASASRIELTWSDNADDEIGFKIERRKDGDESFTQVGTVGENVTSYSAGSLQRNTAYDFRVRAYSETDDSDYSTVATAATENEKFSWCFIGTLME